MTIAPMRGAKCTQYHRTLLSAAGQPVFIVGCFCLVRLGSWPGTVCV